MTNSFDAIRGRLADLANAVDDAMSAGDVTEAGVEALEAFARDVETLTREFDRALRQQGERSCEDDDYERAVAKARSNGFAETGGRDWT